MIIFDSNIWIAYLNTDDSQHNDAVAVLENNQDKVLISEYIILEVATVLSMRVAKSTADSFIDFAVNNQDIAILPSSKTFFNKTLDYFLKYKKTNLSFVDVSLLVLAESYRVVTLDQELEREINKLFKASFE